MEELQVLETMDDVVWRFDRPPDRCIVTSNGSETIVLYQIGPEVDAQGDEILGLMLNGKVDEGSWVLEVRIETRTVRVDFGSGLEREDEVIVISEREATDEEMIALREGHHPWDIDLWIEIQLHEASV